MSRSMLQLLCLLWLSACAASASAAAAGVHRSCSISADWSLNITGRSTRDFYAVLPAPHCLFISDRSAQTSSGSAYYAVDFVSGSVAWQWDCALPPAGSGAGSGAQGQCGVDPYLQNRGGVVPSPSAADRVYVSAWQMGGSAGNCDVMSALDAATGQTLYEDVLCNPQLVQGDALAMPFQLAGLPAGEELLIHAAALRTGGVMLRVLNGSTGAAVSAFNVSGVLPSYPQPINMGREGLFAVQDTVSSIADVYQLLPDGSVRLAASNVTALSRWVASYLPSLASQPALNLDEPASPHFVIATDVLTNSTRWSSADPFLLGSGWGSNGSFSHFSTEWRQLAVFPALFVVLNTAAGPNVSVAAAVGLYELSSGKQLALTPTFAFSNLTGYSANPNLWELQGERALVLRADDLWAILDLPSLAVRCAGKYDTWDAAFHSNNWLVSDDGSYVALPYDSGQSVRGYSPRQTYVAPAVSSSSSSSSSASASAPPLPAASSSGASSASCPACSPAPAPDAASSSAFTPLVIGLLGVIAALLLALLLVGVVAYRRMPVSASRAGGEAGRSTESKQEPLLSSEKGFHP